jgi:hypothetical protein
MTKLLDLTPTKAEGTIDKIFDIDCVSNADIRQKHVDLAVARGLPQVQFRALRKGKVAIVASAPSVGDYVDTLKEWDGEIWGINGAFAWMLHRGIKPSAFIGIDPEEMLKDYLIEMPDDATYYLAAQVHPGVFDHLQGKNVRLWFQADGEMKFPIGTVTVPGGSSCLGRAPYLACLLGWQDVHIFGGDSSFTHKTHVYGGNLPEKGSGLVLSQAGGEVFKTTRTMMAQACEMVEIVQNFPGSITIHGHGLMQAMVQDLKDSGQHEALIAEEAAIMGGLNRKQRRAMKKQAA